MKTIIYSPFLALSITIILTQLLVAKPKTIKGNGGSIKTELGYNIAENINSGLEREWIVVNEDTLPVTIDGLAGVKIIYDSTRRGGSYFYSTELKIDVKEPVSY